MSESASASAGKYSDYSREQLIAEINRLKKTKKYGLVWEHKTEQVIEDFKNGKQPYLKEVTDKRIENAPNEPTNLIIEGDNFDALSILNYTHAGKVDVIYIDPPYNTGNKDFIYNDNYVDSEDEFRHSKWLSFMEPRLKLAKNLLKEDGVIFISIDDNELANLLPLCYLLFGEDNTDIFIWRKSGIGRDGKMKNTTTFRKDHEYVIVSYKHEKVLNKLIEIPNFNNDYNNADNDPRGDWMSGSLSRSDKASNPNHENYYSVTSPSGKVITRQFEIPKEEFERLDADNRISWGKNGDSVPRIKIFINEERYITPYSLLLDKGTTTEGTKELNIIMNSDLGQMRPKPSLLIRTLTQLASKENSVIVDFFAGSGTTGQSVLELNMKDGGHRQFILCTNNGDKGPDSTKIAEEITYPRIRTVITGARQDGSKYSDGIPANLRYYKINHREKKPSIDANRQDMATYMEDIIQVKENAFERIEANEDLALYKNSERFVGIVFDPFVLEEIIENIKEINNENKPVKLYVFSYSRDAFEDNYGTNFEIEFVAMPEGLLKTYANIVAETKKEDA